MHRHAAARCTRLLPDFAPQANKGSDDTANRDADDPLRVVGCQTTNGAPSTFMGMFLVLAWVLRNFIRRKIVDR